ncbi:MAG: glycosyltransferase family 2 protein, partial [Alphaproteobacteria bacterium]|nr:glycosyltransferase family 2 protein [Alphaproteobacteria bacterium]
MTNTQFLRRADDRVIDFDIPVCSCSIVRNELVRLPYLLEYHRKLGIKQFFFIDNLSTDGTLDYIKSQPDCIPLIAESSFRDAHGGSLWIQEAIFKFG